MASSLFTDFDSSNPEIIYHDCIAYQEKDGKTKEFYKCPLCKEFCENFYCAGCVNNGNFILSCKKAFALPHSEGNRLVRFADKKLNKYKTQEKKAVILKSYEIAFAEKIETENVKLAILLTKEKIKILKQNIEIFRNNISEDEKRIDVLASEKKKSTERQKESMIKTKKLREKKKLKLNEICLKESAINSKLNPSNPSKGVSGLAKDFVGELITIVFPITQVSPQRNENSKAAQKDTYVQGQWVIAGNPQDDMLYQIVASRIPCTGDYSEYPSWCSEYTTIKESENYVEGIPKDLLSSHYKHLFDTAYGISSALTNIAQLVDTLAVSMDVHLPMRSSITDFSRDKNVKRFHHNVAKLNANIINLCLSRNIDVTELSPHRTVSNLLLYIDSFKDDNSKSIRYLNLREQEEMLESLEDSIFKDLPVCDDSDNDNVGADFVHLSDDDILEVPEAEPVTTNPPESLITSVMSFWKGGFGLG